MARVGDNCRVFNVFVEFCSRGGHGTFMSVENDGLAVDLVGRKGWWSMVVMVRLWAEQSMKISRQFTKENQ